MTSSPDPAAPSSVRETFVHAPRTPMISKACLEVSMTTVMLVEDDPAFLARFCRIIAGAPEFSLIAAVGDMASARLALARQAPDVLLTDLGLPDGNGIDLIRETARMHPATDIMV